MHILFFFCRNIELDTLNLLNTSSEAGQSVLDKQIRKNLQEEIERSILTTERETQKQIDISIKIRNEMSLFENGAVCGPHLKLANQYLLMLSPTNLKTERAFSPASFIANKMRTWR